MFKSLLKQSKQSEIIVNFVCKATKTQEYTELSCRLIFTYKKSQEKQKFRKRL